MYKYTTLCKKKKKKKKKIMLIIVRSLCLKVTNR